MASENPVNYAYKHFILKVLTPEDWESADRNKENLLAKAVYTLVSEKKGHKGFYFPDSQYDNTYTEEKLEERAARFVHLSADAPERDVPPAGSKVKTTATSNSSGRTNSSMPTGRCEHRMLFVVAENEGGFIRPRDVYPDYDQWFGQVIKRKDVPYIPEVAVPVDADARYEQIKKLIEDKLIALIDAAWYRLIDNVPQ